MAAPTPPLNAEHLRSHHPDYRFMRGFRTTDGKDLFIRDDPAGENILQ